MSLPPHALLLNGFPGVGKLTVAKAFEDRLKKDNRIPCCRLDNHLLIDPVMAIHPIRNEAHYKLRKDMRRTICRGLKSIEDDKTIIILTSALSTSNKVTLYDDIEQFSDYVEVAEARHIPLVMVNVLCDEATNLSRLTSDERRHGSKTKLTDAIVAQTIRRETRLLTREQASKVGRRGQVIYREIDTTTSTGVKEIVSELIEFLLVEVSAWEQPRT